MASASLLAYLIVSKFADGLPLYRIAGRLARLGIELSHTLMSEWLVQCAELLENLHQQMTARVLDSGQVYTDDTSLPLQHHDPARHNPYEAKLWVYAKDKRHGPPLIVYAFSKSRTRDAPLTYLKDYRGYLQADAYPGYDPLFLGGKITEVACNVHARRCFVEAADLLKNPGRPHEAPAFYKELFRIERQIKDLTDPKRHWARQERTVPLLTRSRLGSTTPYTRCSRRTAWGSGALCAEALGRVDEVHRSRASGRIEQLCRALHESGGDRTQSLSLRRLRARRTRRGDLLFTDRVT